MFQPTPGFSALIDTAQRGLTTYSKGHMLEAALDQELDIGRTKIPLDPTVRNEW